MGNVSLKVLEKSLKICSKKGTNPLRNYIKVKSSRCCCMFSVYESGACFSPDVLDITTEDILGRFVEVTFSWKQLSLQLSKLGSLSGKGKRFDHCKFLE